MANIAPRVEQASALMRNFAERTGVGSRGPQKRYLWTDAFAVCNFLALAGATRDSRQVELARELVDGVHHTLGRFRSGEARSGWISGLDEVEGERHPTRGGLRIGKPMPERGVHEVFDEDLEWERDGQYFHYLTKWMHALDQFARAQREARYNFWARELAAAALRGFGASRGVGSRRGIVWKMSVDLSRPLVPAMGAHDPLDGFTTFAELRATAQKLPSFGDVSNGLTLERESRDLFAMLEESSWATPDPLGIGGLLMDCARLAQLAPAVAREASTPAPSEFDVSELADRVLAEAVAGLRSYAAREPLVRPGWQRLAFRELGLAIGLAGLRYLKGVKRSLLSTAERFVPLGESIVAFWADSGQHQAASWTEHRDINEVMLATSLLPDGFLELSMS
ncbi:MAG: hypothetical protein ACOY0T_15140 [Myxococcota bacterium]